MGNLNEHSGAVTGPRIAPASPAVRQVDEDFYPFENDIVGLDTRNVRDKSYPTRIVFVPRIVKALRLG
jgi:hypothetical protein